MNIHYVSANSSEKTFNSPTSDSNKELVETLAETNKLLRELLKQNKPNIGGNGK